MAEIVSDQDRHAQFMIEAMKALVAKTPFVTPEIVAAEAAKMADVMLEAHLKRFEAQP